MSYEAFHVHCLDEMEKFAQDYMRHRYGQGESKAVIWKFQTQNEFVLESQGCFSLPPKSGNLVLNMARFARCTLGRPTKIEGMPYDTIPEPCFCLQSLLYAAFPKNLETNVFRQHDCAISAGSPLSVDAAFRSPSAAFGGLGVLMMRQCRILHGMLLPDADVLRKCDGYFLSIIDE